MPPNAGANRYELKELLGEGGMGVVYKALDTRTNSYVALKTLRDSTDPALLEMFKREWALLGEVPHPNIVDVRDVDEIEENGVRKPCFIMPLLPGCTLAALIKSSSPRLTTEFVVNMVSQVCKGLQAAHEKDLIHRDLKPSNIFIMDDDTAKIIDFGLVHAVGSKSSTGLKGTWQYMAPEQIDGSKLPNRSFDIFSLGVVAYEALTGHQPFKRAKAEDTAEALRYFVPQAISERNPKVPQLVGKAIHVAMAKQPTSRYATAREFAETLQKAYRNEYIERFDPAKIRPRIDRAKKAFSTGDSEFASEILTELEAEGNLDPDITLLRSQIDEFNRHKRVRQLFEAAQTRLEQDEIPLALEKLDEIRKIDPQNSEAIKLRKKIEQQRSQQQMNEWLDLARKHLDRHDFSEARRALKEVFNLKYDDPEAAALKTQIDNREKEVETARAEKEHLYSHALRYNQNGEISSALSKLEKLLELSRNTPGASVPERDKVFQSFYNDVRTERDRVENAYSDASRHLSEKDFEKALGICDGILHRYPQNPQFQALRLKAEHSQRQELSAYIAEVGRSVDSEPNLDRRVGLLEEACKRYPSEGQFARQLSLARELRDLVGSIVNRARNYEEQGQFAEAITQWNTLANIHPQYPGIDFEISQLERRREQQTEEDKKSRLVEKIDRALGNAAYTDALRLSESGLVEFPDNPELLALLRLSQQGLEQNREANRLFEEAKVQRSSGDLDRAVALLRQALDLDHRNIVIQNTLVNLLTERAHTLLDTDPDAAEPIAEEAARLDPEHPSVNKVKALIAQAKRRRYVEQTVLQARELQNIHRNQAIEVLKQGLSVYPGDGRLQQTLSNLQMDEPRALVQPKEEKQQAFVASVFGPPVVDEKTVVYPVNGGTPKTPPAAQPPKVPNNRQAVKPPPPPPQAPQLPEAPRGPSAFDKLRDAGALLAQNVKHRLGNGSNSTLIGVGIGLVASALLIAFASWYFKTPSDGGTIPPPPHATRQIKISTTPETATVTIDGNPATGRLTQPLEEGSTHKITVSAPGYKTIENPSLKVTGSDWNFPLELQPLNISGAVSDSTGTVLVDDQPVGQLDDGGWSYAATVKPSLEHHTLTVKGKNGAPLFKIGYTIAIGKPPILDPLKPRDAKDLLVYSSLGKDAIIYSGNSGTKLLLPDGQSKQVPPDGLAVAIEESPASFSIANGKTKPDPFTVLAGPAPALGVLLHAVQNLVQASVTITPKNATFVVDGTVMHPHGGVFTWQAAPPGPYPAKITADGMEDKTFSIALKKGVPFVAHYELKPRTKLVVGPTAASLLFSSDGEPGAAVSIVNGRKLGDLDAKGYGKFNLQPGTYVIELSKPGYLSATFPAVTLVDGKEIEPYGNKRLRPAQGSVKFVVKPAGAVVSYSRQNETETHKVADTGKPLLLPFDTYTFTAAAEKFQPATKSAKVEANHAPVEVSFDLQPVVEQPVAFVSPTSARPENGNWYHGLTNRFIPLTITPTRPNTIFFSKELSKQSKLKKMSWQVFLDDDNMIIYTLDSGGLTIDRFVEGIESKEPRMSINLTSSMQAPSWAVRIKVEKNAVILSQQNGNIIDTFHDEKHNWSQAKVFIKGDNHFIVWPGQ